MEIPDPLCFFGEKKPRKEINFIEGELKDGLVLRGCYGFDVKKWKGESFFSGFHVFGTIPFIIVV